MDLRVILKTLHEESDEEGERGSNEMRMIELDDEETDEEEELAESEDTIDPMEE